MKKIQLSVIIPTLFANSEHFNEAIASIENQSYRNFEVLILVDGPIENRSLFLEILGQLSCNHSVYFSKKRRGVARSLNILARLANGDYLVRMDDDDICHIDRFQIQYDQIKSNDYDVVGSSIELIDQKGRAIQKTLTGFNFEQQASAYDLLFGNIFFHPSVVIRKSWCRLNKYNSKWDYGEDRELWMRTYKHSKFLNVDKVLLKYRIRSKGHVSYLRAIGNKTILLRKYRQDFGFTYPVLEALLVLLAFRCRFYDMIRFK